MATVESTAIKHWGLIVMLTACAIITLAGLSQLYLLVTDHKAKLDHAINTTSINFIAVLESQGFEEIVLTADASVPCEGEDVFGASFEAFHENTRKRGSVCFTLDLDEPQAYKPPTALTLQD